MIINNISARESPDPNIHCKEFIKHQDTKISNRWLTGGENEFGRLFQGFTPNKVDGLDDLE